MSFTYQLTWVQNKNKNPEKSKPKNKNHYQGRWRKRYKGKTYYLKTKVNGKRDRPGYLAALNEWRRLKSFIDGTGPDPYSATGALIPEDQISNLPFAYHPPAPKPEAPAPVQSIESRKSKNGYKVPSLKPVPTRNPNDPPWILGTAMGLMEHSDQVIKNTASNPHLGEKRVDKLVDIWIAHRLKMTERGELSKKQWDEDRAKIKCWVGFLLVNYQTTVTIDQVDATILNLYRQTNWNLIDPETPKEDRISRVTLKKRLGVLVKFYRFLLDESIIDAPPRDLSKYGRVSIEKPAIHTFTVDEIKTLVSHSIWIKKKGDKEIEVKRRKLYLMLALNCGFLQREIATLKYDDIDWSTGIISRPRPKTNVPHTCKLWPSTLALLKQERNPDTTGPLLVGENGKPLLVDKVNEKGNLTTTDTIRLAFTRTKKRAKFECSRSFKHLRKTAAQTIENSRPDLTSVFLAHSEKTTKKFYVDPQREAELFAETDKLESHFGFTSTPDTCPPASSDAPGQPEVAV